MTNEPVQSSADNNKKLSKAVVVGSIVLFILGCVNLFCAFLVVNHRHRPTTPRVVAATEWDAIEAAQRMVQSRLKYPHDASFPGGETSVRKPSGDGGVEWQIRGLVRAKNAFGAELTYDYVAVIEEHENKQFTPYIVNVGDECLYADPEVVAAAKALYGE